ncbi:hypothetical protein GT031_19665 [Streptomyces sp. SID2888]|nr:hypothetical protein [Streptomyces sp. SID2888]
MRTTTGGMGRDPGMLIRIRVVSVVSVLRSSDCVAEGPPSTPSSEAMGVPYGGVPDGYAAPPRPLAPADELSVSRLKAGSPGWLHRLFRPQQVGSPSRTTSRPWGRRGGAHHHTGHS